VNRARPEHRDPIFGVLIPGVLEEFHDERRETRPCTLVHTEHVFNVVALDLASGW
jgi:hypothetical protein